MFIIQELEGQKRQWELPEGTRLSIGRAQDNEIRLDDLRVSRHHAELRAVSREQAELWNVSNGNLVLANDKKITNTPHILCTGDYIKIISGSFNISWKEDAPLRYIDEPLSMGTTMVPATPSVSQLLTTSFSSSQSREDELKELRRKAEILAQLCEMSAALATVFDTGAILDYATEVVMRSIPADCCAALVRDPCGDPKTVSIRFRNQGNGPVKESTISRTAVRTAMDKRVMLSSHDVTRDVDLNVSQSALMSGIRSLACAPLVGRVDVHGALYIDRRHVLETFTELDTQLLAAVAAQAATALEAANAHERMRREQSARDAFARFMPEHIIKELVENPQKFQLGGTNRRVTVLFCDVRGFAKLAHRARPETIVDLLNILFTEMAAAIFKHHGTLNKYLGDGLMALFGAPVKGDTDAVDAVAAAIGMQQRIKAVNEQLTAKNLPNVMLGIGINTGEATVGCIGAEQRLEYTAIGDTVNIASRIEGIAKPGQILVTQDTAEELGSKFPLSEPWTAQVKHIEDPVKVYSVIYSTGAEDDTADRVDL
ncbi:MAG TPA: adenylate/guanylate cyclase domain-containing protein [Pyrinomonadaceae bacterium]|jgi:adenylate cyclase